MILKLGGGGEALIAPPPGLRGFKQTIHEITNLQGSVCACRFTNCSHLEEYSLRHTFTIMEGEN